MPRIVSWLLIWWTVVVVLLGCCTSSSNGNAVAYVENSDEDDEDDTEEIDVCYGKKPDDPACKKDVINVKQEEYISFEEYRRIIGGVVEHHPEWNRQNFWRQPGDLDRFFERLLAKATRMDNNWRNWEITLLSRPAAWAAAEAAAKQSSFWSWFYPPEEVETKENDEQQQQQKDGPWMIQIDNFFSKQEAEKLIRLAHGEKFSPTLTSSVYKDGAVYQTVMAQSQTAMCLSDYCQVQPITVDVYGRMLHMLGLPIENGEALRFVKYNVGDYMKRHHDFGPNEINVKQGVRVLTVFWYLNGSDSDDDETNNKLQGGETYFPDLNITIVPKKGRIVIWPNVLSNQPNRPDLRTIHEGLPVKQGVKYAINAIFHQRAFDD